MKIVNPFEFDAANNLPEDDIIDYFIEDHNYSRFLNSSRNIFLLGERGSGKTMTLLYHSFRVQVKKKLKNGEKIDFSKIGVHIPCNTPLFHKKEYLLFNDEFKKSILCEHYLVLTIVYSICEALSGLEEIDEALSSDELFEDIEYLLATNNLKRKKSFAESLKLFVSRELNVAQQKINGPNANEFFANAYSFSSFVIPLITVIKSVDLFKSSHFMLMIDDAHDLNKYQTETINSWIAYRDHSDFSFKIATAKINRPSLITATGGSILEGHDFISIDMEKSFQNSKSDFYSMAKDILERRLKIISENLSVETFFPPNLSFVKDLDICKEIVKKRFEESNSTYTPKQLSDYIYKYSRAEYFKSRGAKSNLPPYSGFETIVDLSSGVIRNLLDPCYWMYDSAISQNKGNSKIKHIPYAIQNDIIKQRSLKMWERLKNGLDKEIEGCTFEDGKYLNQLFENIHLLFIRRLREHKSEPRAITFSISGIEKDEIKYDSVIHLLEIAQKAQMLYTRISSGKEMGKHELYYAPNRMLMPAKGLDPHGQYSRVSIKLLDLYNAAFSNKELPFSKDDEEYTQGNLFE
ncbi:hypothetical protein [Sphingobacterium faecium]|uniref:ORC-CDC6 family AAA ATPase n=1 Tax=Sphingobacterium faecium TaxID=34087 RepID=UPI002479BA00|nr:hypothetical protein [Sphingobacterium faecium]WGQ15034.1 hypothetical protein QG727_01195 [Sphingobacterium faecium]